MLKKIFFLVLVATQISGMEKLRRRFNSSSPKSSPPLPRNNKDQEKEDADRLFLINFPKLPTQQEKQAQYAKIKTIWFNHPNKSIRSDWQKQLLDGLTHDPLKTVMASTEPRDYCLYYHPKDKKEPKLIAHFEPTSKKVITYTDNSEMLTISYKEFLSIFRKK